MGKTQQLITVVKGGVVCIYCPCVMVNTGTQAIYCPFESSYHIVGKSRAEVMSYLGYWCAVIKEYFTKHPEVCMYYFSVLFLCELKLRAVYDS